MRRISGWCAGDNFKIKLQPNAQEQMRYAAYVKWCEDLGMSVAPIDEWQRMNKSISETAYS